MIVICIHCKINLCLVLSSCDGCLVYHIIFVQSTCTVNSGASGGPLVGEDGQVYGIVTCNAK